MKKLLIFLQNAYSKTPEVTDGYIPSLSCEIFQNSHTGRRLKNAIPNNVTVFIRNSNPGIGNNAASNLPADVNYINSEVNAIKPDIILACGNNAINATSHLQRITMPHPACRTLSNQTLLNIRKLIENQGD